MRHDSYQEGCWTIWYRNSDQPLVAGYCFDTASESLSLASYNSLTHPEKYRLVRLHRVTIEDVVKETSCIHVSTWTQDLEKAMDELGVSLTERWVAAEERPVEEEAPNHVRRAFVAGARYARTQVCGDMDFEEWLDWAVGEFMLGKPVPQHHRPPADPDLARLLAAWEMMDDGSRQWHLTLAEKSADVFPREKAKP